MGKCPKENTACAFMQKATLEKLKCFKCRRYLSVLPIYKSPKGEAICGRCPVDASLDLTRDELYEHAIEFQKFPCSYRDNGCLEDLLPVHLAQHEDRCPHKKHDCPTKVYNNCTWQGNLADLLEHFEKKHPTFILKDCRFEVDFINNHSENYVMPYGEDLYVVTREGNSKEKSFAVTINYLGSCTDVDNYIYDITLESGNKNYKYSLQQNIGARLEFQGPNVSEMLHDPMNIIANISITTKPSESLPSGAQSDSDSVDYEKLRDFECPICTEYFLLPIYQCDAGHSICEQCKAKQSVCPICQVATYSRNTRNFNLENFVMKTIYPCRHEGCRFTTKARHIKQHEATCLFGPFVCPLKEYENCASEFRISELFNHVKTMHYENLLELDCVSVPFDDSFEEDIVEAYILKQPEYVFRICFMYRHEENTFYWAVQLVGPPEESAKYNFELEIIDTSGRNMKVYVKSGCTPLVDKEETFGTPGNYIYFHGEQIDKLIKNQLTYRILISKKN